MSFGVGKEVYTHRAIFCGEKYFLALLKNNLQEHLVFFSRNGSDGNSVLQNEQDYYSIGPTLDYYSIQPTLGNVFLNVCPSLKIATIFCGGWRHHLPLKIIFLEPGNAMHFLGRVMTWRAPTSGRTQKYLYLFSYDLGWCQTLYQNCRGRWDLKFCS